jgi:hypothetical protein
MKQRHFKRQKNIRTTDEDLIKHICIEMIRLLDMMPIQYESSDTKKIWKKTNWNNHFK